MPILALPYGDPIAAFSPYRDAPMSLLLHGCGDHPDARWSYICVEPRKTLTISEGDQGDALAQLRALLAEYAAADPEPSPAPFRGGLAGFFAYECAGRIDPAMRAPAEADAPLAAFGCYDAIAAYDHDARVAFVHSRISAAHAQEFAQRLTTKTFNAFARPGAVQDDDGRALYGRHVESVRDHIRVGDIFQANISRLYEGRLGAGDHPFALFKRLCAISPAPYCAYMRLPDRAIVSNTPERLVALRRDPHGLRAKAAPIKGTRPRGRTPDEDAGMKAALLDSEKDRAENVMIVDLMRNDLSRICIPGSVLAPSVCAVESFANVHHLVSRIEGVLRPGADAIDLVGAVFPAGSITGAPKIKAMEIIRKLESVPRGASFGSIGWIGADGAMELNVLIRTAICLQRGADWRVRFRAGGGVTYDSNAQEETDEVDAKAASLLRALHGDGA